jgi:hypothetical protein
MGKLHTLIVQQENLALVELEQTPSLQIVHSEPELKIAE